MKNDVKYLNWSEDEIRILYDLETCVFNTENSCNELLNNIVQTRDNLKYNYLKSIYNDLNKIQNTIEQQIKYYEHK